MLLDRGCLICRTRRGPVCDRCRDGFVALGAFDSNGIDRCRSAFALDDNLMIAITALKYRGERRVARWLAAQMEPLVPRAADVITFVPTTTERKHRSGYDHGEVLARAVAAASGLRCRALLRREGDRRQTGRSRSDRVAGPDLRGATRADPFVIVVDDVITTGSSLRVAADQLRLCGATRVVGLTAARTQVTGNPNASTIRPWMSKSAQSGPR